MTFADRVAYQRAIEEVYWRHRIWPKERRDSKPSMDVVVSSARIEKKVQDYLRNSRALEDYGQQPISSQLLQAEMERMAQHTKNPKMLRELFEALGNDPFVIAECLARPALSERLLVELNTTNPKPGNKPRQRGQSKLHSQRVGGASDTATDPPVSTRYSLPALASNASTCTDNTWRSLTDLPARRANHTAVWTGSEMIVFGGVNYENSLGTGGRYNPATDSWSKVNLTHAPVVRNNHTAVWTGTEMIVWGGYNQIGSGAIYLNSGGKYNPASDSWTPTSITNAPTARGDHTAVWTGTRMLIWGGFDATGLPNTGGRYNPITNSWQAITTTNAPEGRYQHSVVWTGTAMVIWGGRKDVSGYLSSGAKYNPGSNAWTSISAIHVPAARFGHSAVWTGTEMIIWGGWNGNPLSDGARYNPNANTWVALNAINPPQARYLHSAVWTGSEMIIWGGNDYAAGQGTSGSRYNPATNKWTAMSLTNAPSPRDTHTTVWTGSEMIVFGGGYGETNNTGGRYDPAANTWAAIRTTNTPAGRYEHTAVWTGSEMIVWGGAGNYASWTNTGGRYDPALDTWAPTSAVNAPVARSAHTVIWTGTEMIVWGGWYWDGLSTLNIFNTGGKYNPATDTWIPTTLTGAPDPRRWHSAAWTGSEMIVWGGESNIAVPINTGGRYNPGTDSWLATSTTNAPSPRTDHTAVWTGNEMIIFGGGSGMPTNTGGRYNPITNHWITTRANTQAHSGHTAIWTGNEMIVWGGYDGSVHVNTGARYKPSTNTWTATSLFNVPDGRIAHTAIWTGNEMIVWGGYSNQQDRFFNTGGRYNPITDSWTATTTVNAPHEVESPTAVWTGSQMIVWGGFSSFYDPFGHYTSFLFSTGGRYCAGTPSPASTSQLLNISTRARVGTGDNVLIGGFIVNYVSKKVILRGFGPSLTHAGVVGALADPVLELHQPSGPVITNDNWRTTQQSEILGTGIPPTSNLESAIVATLPVGNYTVILRGKGNTSGVGLVEIYDLEPDGLARLANISSRGLVGSGDNVMIGGIIVGQIGRTNLPVLMRAIGPTLAESGVHNPLADPTLELHNSNGAVIAFNDNWKSSQRAAIEATGIAPTNDRESAILTALAPGNYTMIVRGKGTATGIALVENYSLQPPDF